MPTYHSYKSIKNRILASSQTIFSEFPVLLLLHIHLKIVVFVYNSKFFLINLILQYSNFFNSHLFPKITEITKGQQVDKKHRD